MGYLIFKKEINSIIPIKKKDSDIKGYSGSPKIWACKFDINYQVRPKNLSINIVFNDKQCFNQSVYVNETNTVNIFKSLINFIKENDASIGFSDYALLRSTISKILKKLKPKKIKIKTKSKKQSPAFCYIMKDTSSGLYKIGMSSNPKYREHTLQSEKPSIKMIKVFSTNIEKHLHSVYKSQRVRGEWFSLNKIQIRYICTTNN